jgi:mono/diheme cytochrome c family protein
MMGLRGTIWQFAILVLLAALAVHGLGQGKDDKQSALVARGKYIADDVAVCSQCHTPRDGQGNLDRSKWLEGAPVWLQSARPVQDWPLQAPRIAGDPPGTDAEMITLLTTGIWRDGKTLRPPMPQFRMSADDARAVVAYLKTLTQRR